MKFLEKIRIIKCSTDCKDIRFYDFVEVDMRNNVFVFYLFPFSYMIMCVVYFLEWICPKFMVFYENSDIQITRLKYNAVGYLAAIEDMKDYGKFIKENFHKDMLKEIDEE